ncbi:hypothetical protein DP113_01735 [Brasilonema octagenarum UFV-E1]|uniref:Cyanovirin-N domain-containing protein n=2 Tax=Brasilonema TaxID=383614 RepID=A0A856M8T3_9CYAN|nr:MULTISPECIES: CVNH domain-containing protein [Brasilonema]NMF62670.1 hypothetical protein [Brasilonema octagenarum UFV-OR1]QDL06794.1 hypothetical protein DP114_01745 [Brasilonema sennae CENA114]QDL13163.1 hypothetical protein DP113_01735 [Brasilonema octagenarum UFV-E1]
MFKFNKKLSSVGLLTLTSITGIVLHISSASAKPSTFFSSCRQISVRNDLLQAICRRQDGSESATSLILEGINNVNGTLVFQRGKKSNYFSTCRDIQIKNDTLSATCRAGNGAERNTSLILNDIGNNNGVLVNKE